MICDCQTREHDKHCPFGIINRAKTKDIEYPWGKEGATGWDDYSNFCDWLTMVMGREHVEFVNNAPTQLYAAFTIFAEMVRRSFFEGEEYDPAPQPWPFETVG